MKRHGRTKAVVTDGLRSYTAATREIGNADSQEVGRWLNNRVENSHQPFRRRERAMLRFRRMKTLPKFSSVHASVHNHLDVAYGRPEPEIEAVAGAPAISWWWRHCHHHVVRCDCEGYDLVDDRRDIATGTPRAVRGTAGRVPRAPRRTRTPAMRSASTAGAGASLINQDFNGDIALILCCGWAAGAGPHGPPVGAPTPSASCAPGTRCLRSWEVPHPPRPPRPAPAWSPC